MKIIFFGTPTYVIPVLDTLMKNFEVVAVVTAPDQKTGRKQLLTASPIKEYAKAHHIPTLTPEKLIRENFNLDIENLKLKNNSVDLFVVAAYGKIIPQSILDIPHHGTLNIHPSLLPKYRGPTPLQYALLNGDTETGISIMKLDAKMDHGPILTTQTLHINHDDTFETLVSRAFQRGANLLPQCITSYSKGEIIPQEQDHATATYTKLITKQDGYIDLSVPDHLNELAKSNWKVEIARKIRAYYPWPTVWTKIRIKNPSVAKALEGRQESRIKFLPNEKLQIEGGKPMPKKDFLNGYPELKETIEKIL